MRAKVEDGTQHSTEAIQPNWEEVFHLANRDFGDYVVAESPGNLITLHSSNYRWKPKQAVAGQLNDEVHASLVGSQVHSFQVLRTSEDNGEVSDWTGFLNLFFIAGILLVIGPLATRNLRKARGDLGGAVRLAAFTWLGFSGSWFLVANYPAHATLHLMFVAQGLLTGVGGMIILMALYLALEPFSQRYWPRLLVSWGQFIQGNWHHSLLRGHVLLGLAFGCVTPFAQSVLYSMGYGQLGVDLDAPLLMRVTTGSFLAELLVIFPAALLLSFEYLTILVLVRAVFKRKWIAIALAAIIGAVITSAGATSVPTALLGVGTSTLALFVLVRFGLLAVTIAFSTTALLAAFPAANTGPDQRSIPFLLAASLVALVALCLAALPRRRLADPTQG